MEDRKTKFSEIYSKTLGFFKNLKNFTQNKTEIRDYIRTLNNNLLKIISSVKEDILQKNIDLQINNLNLNNQFEKNKRSSELFFRIRIYKKFQKDLLLYARLLKEKTIKDEVLKSLTSFLQNFEVNIEKLFSLFYLYYKKEYISLKEATKLINILFDRNPDITLNLCIESLKKSESKRKNKNTAKTKPLYQVLIDNVDIYPELYRQKFSFFAWNLRHKIVKNGTNWKVNEQIIYYIAKNLPQTFKSAFFKIINLYRLKRMNKVESKNKKLELAMEFIFSNNSFRIFNYFQKRLDVGLKYVFESLKIKDDFLTEFLLRFLVDLIHHIRIFLNEGKYKKNIFLISLKILKFLNKEELYDEYFLIAIQSELKIHSSQFIDDLTSKRDLKNRDLASSYITLTKILEDYLDTIFQS